jgi:acyl-coenzyme A thioesterase PaaI-like protein
MRVLDLWNRFKSWPSGKRIFSLILAKKIPYTGSVGAVVEELSLGKAQVKLVERRAVQNHLDSIHAVALMNISELCSGLALHTVLSPTQRAILVKFEIEYLKKARKVIRAYSELPSSLLNDGFHEIEVKLMNEDQEQVCSAKAKWKVSTKVGNKN